MVFQNNYAITVKFSACHNGDTWLLTNIYGPCTTEGKRNFLQWFKNFATLDDDNWLVVGDFNLLRKLENRNRPGGDVNEMLVFNEAISALGLVELPLYGKKFTWTNKQPSPLLERLDWFFTSSSWTTSYPNSSVSSLVMKTSDHWSCNITISTAIPKGQIFRCDNYWLQHPFFLQTAQQARVSTVQHPDKAKSITTRFKNLRKTLRAWQKNFNPQNKPGSC
jgi:hypothetical protein